MEKTAIMGSELKRRKINPPRRPGGISSSITGKELLQRPKESSTAAGSSLIMQQAKNFAIGQAQQEGCTSNFRICDSPFGNFLIPAIPTRAELSK